jgi:hypothetical protein
MQHRDLCANRARKFGREHESDLARIEPVDCQQQTVHGQRSASIRLITRPVNVRTDGAAAILT